MAVITITITESDVQLVDGIPQSLTLSTDIPSNIFYTLDGTDPTLFSSIYTGILELSPNKGSITVKLYATNGTDNSEIITKTYTTSVFEDTRYPHSATTAQAFPPSNVDKYPFGTNPIQPNQQFLNPGDAGVNTNNPTLPAATFGFDGDSNQVGLTNIPLNELSIVYTTSNARGETGPGIGTFPPFSVQPPVSPPESSNLSDKLFNPKAMVIYQDYTKPLDPHTPIIINSQFFTLENYQTTRGGNQLYNTALDAPPVSGAFLRSHYNPTERTITYYYFDSSVNRWIISKTPYTPAPDAGILFTQNVNSRDKGAGFVFRWYQYKGSVRY